MVRILLTSLLAVLFATSAMAQSVSMPVMVGGEADFDACGANGRVRGLDPNGDNFLSVRNGPNGRAREVDRLHEGDELYVCDERGRWLGVVYGSGTCGATTPIDQRKPYRGGCRSGWVFGDFINVYAG